VVLSDDDFSFNNMNEFFSRELYPNTNYCTGQTQVNTLDLTYLSNYRRGSYNFNPAAGGNILQILIKIFGELPEQ
jgi:spore germination protein YaaH